MSITRTASTDGTADTSAATLAANSSGDLLVIIDSFNQSPTRTISTPRSGWSNLIFSSQGTICALRVDIKTSAGSDTDPGLVLSGTTNWCHQTYVISAADWDGTLAHVTATVTSTSTTTSGANADPPSHDAATADSQGTTSRTIIAAAGFNTGSNVNVSLGPSGYSDFNSQTIGTGSGGSQCASAHLINQSGTTYDPGTFTSDSDNYFAVTITFVEAAGGGGVVVTANHDIQ